MPAQHAPRHAAAPVGVFSSAVGGWRHRLRRGAWIPLAGVGVYLVLIGSAALGGPGLRAPFMPQQSTMTPVEPSQDRADSTPDSEPTVTGTSATPIPTDSPSPTTVPAGTVPMPDPAGTTATGSTRRTVAPSSSTSDGSPTQPAATPSASAPGKSGQAPGVTKKPPKPKP